MTDKPRPTTPRPSNINGAGPRENKETLSAVSWALIMAIVFVAVLALVALVFVEALR